MKGVSVAMTVLDVIVSLLLVKQCRLEHDVSTRSLCKELLARGGHFGQTSARAERSSANVLNFCGVTIMR